MRRDLLHVPLRDAINRTGLPNLGLNIQYSNHLDITTNISEDNVCNSKESISAYSRINTLGLTPTISIGSYLSSFFPFKFFNRMQSNCIDDVFYKDDNCVVSSPTGSGKTVLFELAFLRLFFHPEYDRGKSKKESINSVKAVYLAPLKALCSEKVDEWTKKFTTYGIKCIEFTSESGHDIGVSLRKQLESAHIIVATPEKWDSITRKWIDLKDLLQCVRLLCIDEVHLLGKPKRGPVLEAIVSRMRVDAEIMASRANINPSLINAVPPFRILAVSATIANLNDIGSWLAPQGSRNAIVRAFDDSVRPCPITTHVIGFPSASTSNGFIVERMLTSRLPFVIKDYSEGRPSLVFCVTKKGCETAANELANCGISFVTSHSQRAALNAAADRLSVNDRSMRSMILAGVAVHHAGLSSQVRKMIETLFTEEHLRIVCATSTLAQGVNLPARLVVVKSTLSYKGSGYAEYDEMEILQMVGRAGRPQFDDRGIAVIMTQESTANQWRQMTSGSCIIRSQLRDSLGEHVNAEIGLTLHKASLNDCIGWLSRSLLWQQSDNNNMDNAYGKQRGDGLIVKLVEELSVLVSLQLIKISVNDEENKLNSRNAHMNEIRNEENQQYAYLDASEALQILKSAISAPFMQHAICLHSTQLGRTIARSYLLIETARLFMSWDKSWEGKIGLLGGVLWLLSSAKEFAAEFAPRQSERKALRTFAESPDQRWPFKKAVSTSEKKTFVLLGGLCRRVKFSETGSWELSMHQSSMWRLAERLLRALEQICYVMQWGDVLTAVHDLAWSLRHKVWIDEAWETPHGLYLLESMNEPTHQKLVSAGLGSLKELSDKKPSINTLCAYSSRSENIVEKWMGWLEETPTCELQVVTSNDQTSGRLYIMQTSGVANLEGKVVGWSETGKLLMHESFKSPGKGLRTYVILPRTVMDLNKKEKGVIMDACRIRVSFAEYPAIQIFDYPRTFNLPPSMHPSGKSNTASTNSAAEGNTNKKVSDKLTSKLEDKTSLQNQAKITDDSKYCASNLTTNNNVNHVGNNHQKQNRNIENDRAVSNLQKSPQSPQKPQFVSNMENKQEYVTDHRYNLISNFQERNINNNHNNNNNNYDQNSSIQNQPQHPYTQQNLNHNANINSFQRQGGISSQFPTFNANQFDMKTTLHPMPSSSENMMFQQQLRHTPAPLRHEGKMASDGQSQAWASGNHKFDGNYMNATMRNAPIQNYNDHKQINYNNNIKNYNQFDSKTPNSSYPHHKRQQQQQNPLPHSDLKFENPSQSIYHYTGNISMALPNQFNQHLGVTYQSDHQKCDNDEDNIDEFEFSLVDSQPTPSKVPSPPILFSDWNQSSKTSAREKSFEEEFAFVPPPKRLAKSDIVANPFSASAWFETAQVKNSISPVVTRPAPISKFPADTQSTRAPISNRSANERQNTSPVAEKNPFYYQDVININTYDNVFEDLGI